MLPALHRVKDSGMSVQLSRRSMLQLSSLALTARALDLPASPAPSIAASPVHLNLNENAFGPSPQAASAIQREFPRLSRYATADLAAAFIEQIAAYERVSPEQIVPGEILGALGLYLGRVGGPGGEFVYSTPGYLALVDAASHVGGVGVGVPLNAQYENDLPALLARITPKTRALYLINPHNPTGTLSGNDSFKQFLREASKHTPVIVDEAYLEYSADFADRSAVSLTREGANVLVFRTFDKIYGLAGLPIGYTVAPKELAKVLRKQGLGDAEGLGRLNIVSAQAALADQAHVSRIRATVATERTRWLQTLEGLRLPHTASASNFVFIDTGRPHADVAAYFSRHGVTVARVFPPYETWLRITIGLPDENTKARQLLSSFRISEHFEQ